MFILDREAQNGIRLFLTENPFQPALQFQVFNRVQAFHAHLQRPKAAADPLEVGHRIVRRCQNGDPVTISRKGFDQRPSKIPNVPGGVHRH